MRIVVVGAGGQLGTDLCRHLGEAAVVLTHADIEITNKSSVARAIDVARPDLVVNTAANNPVDRAEDEPAAAWNVNALGPRNLAAITGERSIPLMHISTDYVFGAAANQTTPYRESDAPGPLSVYAVSKLAGEYFVQAINPRHFIVRTCGLYGLAGRAGAGNFVETVLRLSREQERLTIVNDQRCTPTATDDLAGMLVDLLQTSAWGLYHATSSGDATWFEFARMVLQLSGIDTEIVPITSARYGAKARRPQYSVLDCTRLYDVVGRKADDWQSALTRFLAIRNDT